MAGEVPGDDLQAPGVEGFDEARELRGLHDVGGSAVVRGLDPHGRDLARRDVSGRSLGRRIHAAVVDVDPRPEAAEHLRLLRRAAPAPAVQATATPARRAATKIRIARLYDGRMKALSSPRICFFFASNSSSVMSPCALSGCELLELDRVVGLGRGGGSGSAGRLLAAICWSYAA